MSVFMTSYIRVDFRVSNLVNDNDDEIQKAVDKFNGPGHSLDVSPYIGSVAYFSLFYREERDAEADKFIFKLKLKYPSLAIVTDNTLYSVRS